MSSGFTADRALVAVIGLGMASFVTVHSYVLLQGSGEPTVSTVRVVWFVGLAVLLVVSALLSVQYRRTA